MAKLTKKAKALQGKVDSLKLYPIDNALSIVRTSVLPAMVDLYESWTEGLAKGGDVPPILRMGSWLGGDRDGHPGVTGDTPPQSFSPAATRR